MKPYKEFSPSEFDTKGLISSETKDKLDWLVSVGTNRDADSLTRSNYQVAEKLLEEVDPEGLDHETWNFGHWACGWFEILVVRPNSKAHEVALKIESDLEEYPFLDEDHHSELECEEMNEYWAGMSIRERLSCIQEANKKYGANVSIFAARHDYVPEGMDEYLRD